MCFKVLVLSSKFCSTLYAWSVECRAGVVVGVGVCMKEGRSACGEDFAVLIYSIEVFFYNF